MDDATLLHAFVRDRSEPAFTAIVDRYLPLVHAAALRRLRGDEHRAREAMQMVFTELARKAALLVRHSALAAWLHQSTRWHAANLDRAERRRTRHEQAAAQHQAIIGPDEPASTWEHLRPVLDAALDTLRETDRDAVLQRYFMDRSFAAIGATLGVSENAARMRVERALDVLRTALARHGITSTTAGIALVLSQNAASAVPAGVTSSVVAATACEGATGGMVAAAATTLFMTKIGTGIAAGVALFLALGLWQQESDNTRLRLELAALRDRPAAPASQSVTVSTAPVLVPDRATQELEDEILAAAEFAVPLNPEQKERVRLDTLIRKGELDRDFAPFFRQLRLPPDTLDAFKTLLVERNQAIYDAGALAKEEGLEIASLAEWNELNGSAVAGIDGQIAALLGPDRFAQFREYDELGSYGRGGWFVPPEEDQPVLEQARLLRATDPGFPDRSYHANGWPVDFSPNFVEQVLNHFGEEAAAKLTAANEANAVRRRMGEIARDAALQGRLQLDNISGNAYQSARERLQGQ